VTDDLTSTVGIVALAAGGVAALALLMCIALWVRVRRLRIAQKAVLGESGSHDLVTHAERLQSSFEDMRQSVQQAVEQLDSQLAANEQRLDRAISKTAVVRYDAYNEMSGRQSSSMALLDEEGTGIVMSSILHRDQARLYVKGVRSGEPEYELSPEEDQAVRLALAGQPAAEPSS
jgi:Protein of unknown function (DUF4446)